MAIDTVVHGALFIAPLQRDGSYELPAVPTTPLHVGVSTWNALMSSDNRYNDVPAGTAALRGYDLEAAHGGRHLVVIGRSQVAQPFDFAQVFAFAGRHPEIKTTRDLEKSHGGHASMMQFAQPAVGERIPKDAIGKARPGDVFTELTDAPDGEVTVCVIGINGDYRDATFLRKLQAHSEDLAIQCGVASPTDKAIVVEAPPQKRFD
jgi:hypothetical protein